MTDRFVVVPAAYVFLRRQRPDGTREVLLQFRHGTDYMNDHWAAGAAGHVEAGESVFAAAVREVREELGVTIRETDLVVLTTMHRRGDEQPINQRIDMFFACDTWQGEPAIQEEAKASELQWYPLDELPSPVVPHESIVLDGLHKGELPHLLAVGFT